MSFWSSPERMRRREAPPPAPTRKDIISMEYYDRDRKVFSDPDPHRSKLCLPCQEFITALHSHPWADSDRVQLAIGQSHQSHHATLPRSVWETNDSKLIRQHDCALCALVHKILLADIKSWRRSNETGKNVFWRYHLKPTLYGRMLDLDPRREFGRARQSAKTLQDRWGLGIEITSSTPGSQPTLLPCAIHCSSRPMLSNELNPKNRKEVPFEHRSIQHGRFRPLLCNIELIKSWPARCQRAHGSQCRQSSNELITIRLIDTQDQCISVKNLRSTDTIDYVALSYVWGDKSQSYAASAEAYESLHKKGALQQLELSQTVADAILLVQRLGLRYLWVDALCIQQSSAADKHDQIAQMGFVYQNSLFTVIAAAGVDCDAGLPGLRPETRFKEQRLVHSGDYTLTNALQFPGDKILTSESSKWAVRGWTLQEELLSSRQLIFTQEHIWWRCPCAVWCEGSQVESDDRIGFLLKDEVAGSRLEHRFSKLEPQQYFDLVAVYAKRHLSYPTDALNAFSGILSVLTKYSGTQFLWACMTSNFERQLYWYGQADVRSGTRPEDFPSWSWVGYQGEISFGRSSSYDPLIECYSIHETLDGYAAVKVNVSQTTSYLKPARALTDNPLVVSIGDIQTAYPHASLEADFHLFFYTYSARFLLVPQGRLVLPQLATRYEYREKGRLLGPKADYGYLVPSLEKSELCEMGEWECILLGRRPQSSEYDASHVVVMLVSRTNGLARRHAIADMPEEFWNLSDKSWQLIALG